MMTSPNCPYSLTLSLSHPLFIFSLFPFPPQVDGQVFNFIDAAAFESLRARGKLLETRMENGHWVGLPRVYRADANGSSPRLVRHSNGEFQPRVSFGSTMTVVPRTLFCTSLASSNPPPFPHNLLLHVLVLLLLLLLLFFFQPHRQWPRQSAQPPQWSERQTPRR
jgi:hypothetical protein